MLNMAQVDQITDLFIPDTDPVAKATIWKSYCDAEVARLVDMAERGDPEARELLNDALEIAQVAADELEELQSREVIL